MNPITFLSNKHWNDTQSDYPDSLCVHDLFETQAARKPNTLALIDASQTYTYAQLNEHANQLARTLQQYGVTQESVVGLYFTKSSTVVIYILSVLKAGGTYLLLDPNLPEERLAYFVKNAVPLIIIYDKKMPPAIQQLAKSITTLSFEHTARKMIPENLHTKISSNCLAYIAYTSGSTGNPKGAEITHQSTVNHALAFSRLFNLNETDRIPLMAPTSFDMATEEIIPPLISGCRLVTSANKQNHMPDFHSEIIRQEYTLLNIPAPLWHMWTDYLVKNNKPIPSKLRLVIVGSDKIYTKYLSQWKKLPHADTVDWVAAYGTTETTITSTFYTSAKNDDLSNEPLVPIGKPIANTFLYILDENQQPVPIGAVGELYIGGDGLARGYHRLDDLTAEKFIADPFSNKPGGRMYKTGDMARYRHDGNVVCLGRRDFQVKLNGLRIELGEIETTLLKHPKLKDVAVILYQPDEHEANKRLIAFVVNKKSNVDTEKIRTFARRRLHPYMIPHHIIILPELPRTNNGKIDRKTLEKDAVNYLLK